MNNKQNKNFQIYKHKGKVLAVVVKNSFREKGMTFFTTDKFSQQLAYVAHPKGAIVKPHIHNRLKRIIFQTQESDIIKKGKAKVILYTETGKFFKTVILRAGDTILFASGGHGYKVLEDIELITVKQGPYSGNKDDKKYIELDTKLL